MNAFNPIEFSHRLEEVGFERVQAETLANEMRAAMQELVTHEQLKAELNALFIRQTAAVAAIVAFAATAMRIFT